MIDIECTILSVIFLNHDNGYAVLNAKDKDGGKTFCLVAQNGMLDPKIGFNIIASGDWVTTSKYGKQFIAKEYKEVVPTETDGIVAYLSCGIFKGIGEKIARKIVDALGENTISIIDNNPEKLYEVKGLGDKKGQS